MGAHVRAGEATVDGHLCRRWGVADSPPVHFTEEGRKGTIPERSGGDDYGYAGSNCSTL